MMNETIFACFYQDSIKIGRVHHLALSYVISKSRIVTIGKCFDSLTQKNKNNPFAMFTLFQDNSVVLQLPQSENPMTISTIYPPPTAKEIKYIHYCINTRRVFILLTSGTLCIYKVDRDTAILEKLQ